MAINVGAIAALGAGVVLTWSGIENQKITTTLQDIVSGKKPQPGPDTAFGNSGSGGGGSGGSAPESPAQLSANAALGKTMAAAYGWTGSQWDALYALWERESGWDNDAVNASSGALGIPQALPPSKMYGGTRSATLQIQWGLGYISSTYGSPEGAWAHEEQFGWY
jgi:resuscitation-promoting factor RpfB